MADKSFNIGDMLLSKMVGLNLPPYLSNSAQFSSKEVKETKTIAKLRIHVERAIRRIKELPIFDTPFPLSLLGTVNQLWTVACLLASLLSQYHVSWQLFVHAWKAEASVQGFRNLKFFLPPYRAYSP